MTLNEMIYHRRSCRSYTGVPVDDTMLGEIKSFPMKPLHPEIKVRWEIVSRNQVRTLCPWSTPQMIAIYSEEADGWLENIGFLFQQMDLHLQRLGLGSCWLGLGKMNSRTAPAVEGMRFGILLAFGYPKADQLRKELSQFKRKALGQIADDADLLLEPARLAPSAVNSQPWYFVHGNECYHVYRICNARLEYMNRIDIGIALAHLYVANSASFHCFQADNAPAVADCEYVCSVTL